ncbi:MAG: selenoprotein O, partial [Erythrobacter sp.]|nr:selenoprotein O [Erythrobacter sp.]
AETAPLVAALERFGPLYMAAIARRWCWRLGVQSQGIEEDTQLVAGCEAQMRAGSVQPDAFFFAHRGGRGLPEAFSHYRPVENGHPYWSDPAPQSMLIEEVEGVWAAIDESDDWTPLHAKVAALRRMGEAHGIPPEPAGHA